MTTVGLAGSCKQELMTVACSLVSDWVALCCSWVTALCPLVAAVYHWLFSGRMAPVASSSISNGCKHRSQLNECVLRMCGAIAGVHWGMPAHSAEMFPAVWERAAVLRA